MKYSKKDVIKAWEDYQVKLSPDSLGPTWRVGSWVRVHGDSKSTAQGKLRCYTMIKSNGDFAIKLDYSRTKVFEMQVDKIPHSPAYLEAEAARELLLKKVGESDKEEKREKKRLEHVMRMEVVIEERLQTEVTIIAIRLGIRKWLNEN